jgi:hypothetical protein
MGEGVRNAYRIIGRKTLWEETTSMNLGVEGRIIFKWILKE